MGYKVCNAVLPLPKDIFREIKEVYYTAMKANEKLIQRSVKILPFKVSLGKRRGNNTAYIGIFTCRIVKYLKNHPKGL